MKPYRPRDPLPWEVAHATCPQRAKHTVGPSSYVAASNWHEAMGRTHVQSECPGCGFWLIWTRKPTDWRRRAS